MKSKPLRLIVIAVACAAAAWGIVCAGLWFFEPGTAPVFDPAGMDPVYSAIYGDFTGKDLYISPVDRDDIVPAGDTGMYHVRNTILYCGKDAPAADGFETVGYVAALGMYELRSVKDTDYDGLLAVCEELTADGAEALPDYFEFTPAESEADVYNRGAKKIVNSNDLSEYIQRAGAVTVAVIDDFVGPHADYDLVDPASYVPDDYFDTRAATHGNMVAGLIGGKKTGVFPGCAIRSYCGVNSDLAYWFAAVARAASVDGARVINVSMGYNGYQAAGATAGNENARAFMSDESAFAAACLENLFADPENDCLIVVAAGNGGNDRFYRDRGAYFGVSEKPVLEKTDLFGVFAATDYIDSKYDFFFNDLPDGVSGHVLIVGALDGQGKTASYSNRGADISACGAQIMSCSIDGMYAVSSGTSMAAPQAAGTAALMYGLDGGLTAPEVKRILIETAGENGALNAAGALSGF